MTDDHHGRSNRRPTLLARAVDAILGQVSSTLARSARHARMLSVTHDNEAGEHVGYSLTASHGWLSERQRRRRSGSLKIPSRSGSLKIPSGL
jgi:hypothetical protein